jgi:hypothetical protein
MTQITVGTATAQPGELVYGWFEGVALPTGFTEKLPVMIAQGYTEGPIFWITANIHGNELTGVPAIHETITAQLAQELRGTVIAIPSLNPSGLRTGKRHSYYDPVDPNRSFPEYVDQPSEENIDNILNLNEVVLHALYQKIEETADYLIDLHCYDGVTIPFTIRDRVLYKDENDHAKAVLLQEKMEKMAKAFGLPVVGEFLAEKYIKRKLHRSTSGIALNKGRIPSFTVELGIMDYVDENALQAAKTGILNVLKWAGMLEGRIEPVTTVPVPQPGFNTRRESNPKAPLSGLVRYKVRPGEIIFKGNVIAVITDIFGRELQEVTAPADGWVMANSRGLLVYQGQSLFSLALRDDDPQVVPFP